MELSAPSFKPGEKASYSNTGYLFLADILEKASGISFSDLAQKKLFKPFKMSSTELMSLKAVEIPWSATGYDVLNASTYKYRRNSSNLITQGEGGLLTTLPDFAKWISHLITPEDDKLFWDAFLNPMKPASKTGGFLNFQDTAYSNELFMNHIINPSKSVSKLFGTAYNNGMSIKHIEGGVIYSHSGLSIDSMGSYFWVSPAHKIGYIQLCNFSNNKKPTVKEVLKVYGT